MFFSFAFSIHLAMYSRYSQSFILLLLSPRLYIVCIANAQSHIDIEIHVLCVCTRDDKNQTKWQTDKKKTLCGNAPKFEGWKLFRWHCFALMRQTNSLLDFCLRYQNVSTLSCMLAVWMFSRWQKKSMLVRRRQIPLYLRLMRANPLYSNPWEGIV